MGGQFLASVVSGAFYDELRVAVNPTLPRDAAKKNTLAILYGESARWRGKWIDAFARLFPDVLAFVQRAKRGDYRRLAHLLQRVESDFIFNRVVSRIMRERPDLPLLTIHDAVATTVGDEGYVRNVMAGEFAGLGVRPKLKTERFERTEGER